MKDVTKSVEADILQQIIEREKNRRSYDPRVPTDLARLVRRELYKYEVGSDLNLPRLRAYLEKMEANAHSIQLWQLEDLLDELNHTPLDKFKGCTTQDTYFWRIYKVFHDATNCPCCTFWRGILLMGLFNLVTLTILWLSMK